MRLIILFFLAIFLWAQAAYAKPDASAFGELPSVYDAAISPDGKQIAIISNVDGTYVVRAIDMNVKGAPIRAIALGKGVKPEWIKWANNDRLLLSVWQSEKLRTTPITTGYIYTLDTQTMTGKYLVKPSRGQFRQYNNEVIDFLEDDPDHILMSYSDSNAFAPDIQKVNVATGKDTRLRRGSENVQSWYTDLTGTPRIGQGLHNNSSSVERWVMTIFDVETEKWINSKNYTGLDADTDIIGFTDNPNEMIVRTRNGKDTSGLYIYNLAQKSYTRTLFHDDQYDAGGVILSGDGKRVIGTKFVADTVETKLFANEDTVLQGVRRDFPGYIVDYIDQSKNGEVILFRLSNAYDPGALMMIDSKTKKTGFVASYYPSLEPDDMGEVVSVRYTASDGFKIPAYVTLPPSVTDTSKIKNLPFIILPHGGPYARSSKRFDYFAQFFASRGYGVLQMNFRGSSGYGEKYEDAGRKNWVVMQEDVEDGARWLLEKGYADPERLCIAGWSFGGYAALMGAIKNPDIYKCSISMAGVTDIGELVKDAKKYRFGNITANKYILGGFTDRDEVKENSPLKRADELTIPLFIAHGESDQRVHFDQFTRMKRALRNSDAKVTFMEFEDEDHFLSNQDNRQSFFVGMDKFLSEVNGPSEFAQ